MSDTSPHVIAIIPARSGSKGLPGKNVRPLDGKPLLAWSIDVAQACADIDAVYVSTDSQDYADVARAAGGAVLMRPDELASDTAATKDVIRHHISELETRPDILVLLQPTSPLRRVDDIQACLDPVLSGEAESAATFSDAPFSPFKAFLMGEDGSPVPAVSGFDPWIRRQDVPRAWAINGAVYVAQVDLLLDADTNTFLPGRSRLIDMPLDRSVDIDTLEDFEAAERWLAAQKH